MYTRTCVHAALVYNNNDNNNNNMTREVPTPIIIASYHNASLGGGAMLSTRNPLKLFTSTLSVIG